MFKVLNEIRKNCWEYRKIIRIICGIMVFAGISVKTAYSEQRTEDIANNLVETREVLPENEGKLIFISGTPTIENDGVIIDKEANLQVKNAIEYDRRVLQHVYVEKSKEVVIDKGEDKVSTHDDKKKTVYYVEHEYIPAAADREDEISNGGHVYKNPPKVDLNGYFKMNNLCFGEFKLKDDVDVLKYAETKLRGFTEEEINKNCQDYIASLGADFKVLPRENNEYAYISNGDELGNIHVAFYYTTLESIKPVTVIGKQEGNSIIFDNSYDLEKKEHVYEGILSKDDFINKLSKGDASARKGGTIALVIGVIGILSTLGGKGFKGK